MNDSFLLELPCILRKDIIFLSLQLANNILEDSGRGTDGGGVRAATRLLVEEGEGCRELRLNGWSLCDAGSAPVHGRCGAMAAPLSRGDPDLGGMDTGVMRRPRCPFHHRRRNKGINLAANIKCVE